MIWEAIAAGDILRAAQNESTVARVRDGGAPVFGTARSVGTDTGARGSYTADVREMFLRVTTSTGLDVFWPMRALMTEYTDGAFLVNVRRPVASS
jgi:hypothetical protein